MPGSRSMPDIVRHNGTFPPRERSTSEEIMTPPETDEELLIRIHSGDEQAFVSLYRRRQAAIFRFALHMSGSETVAEDITQEVFLALIRDRCGFDPLRG